MLYTSSVLIPYTSSVLIPYTYAHVIHICSIMVSIQLPFCIREKGVTFFLTSKQKLHNN